jgi:hypothetical protein
VEIDFNSSVKVSVSQDVFDLFLTCSDILDFLNEQQRDSFSCDLFNMRSKDFENFYCGPKLAARG